MIFYGLAANRRTGMGATRSSPAITTSPGPVSIPFVPTSKSTSPMVMPIQVMQSSPQTSQTNDPRATGSFVTTYQYNPSAPKGGGVFFPQGGDSFQTGTGSGGGVISTGGGGGSTGSGSGSGSGKDSNPDTSGQRSGSGGGVVIGPGDGSSGGGGVTDPSGGSSSGSGGGSGGGIFPDDGYTTQGSGGGQTYTTPGGQVYQIGPGPTPPPAGPGIQVGPPLPPIMVPSTAAIAAKLAIGALILGGLVVGGVAVRRRFKRR